MGIRGWGNVALPGSDITTMIHQTLQFQKIVREYSDRVARTARGMLGDERDAEEAVQDVFLKIYHGMKGFKGESEISTWIYRITVNTCISRRRKAPRPEILPDDPAILLEIVDPLNRPDELYERSESKQRLTRLTSELPDREAQAVTLYYLQELDYSRISEIMNMPIGSVATVLHRGRERLHLLMLREEKER
jgi:RNA polymerase sigma-70 factor (ECF subfamily)